MAYHNTTGESGIPLEEYEEKSSVQERAVLGYFRKEQMASPSEVHRMVLPFTPLTSVRRAITNLTGKGYLRKTRATVHGRYARPEHLWIMDGYRHESG
jgi:hypothetical protein